MSLQQKQFLQSIYNSPQISILKNKLIHPTVFYSPVINQKQIDIQKLKSINRSWTDYQYQSRKIVDNAVEKQKREVSTFISPRNIESKGINEKNHLEKQIYILPPVKSIRKLLKNNQSFLQKQKFILSYIQGQKSNKNHSGPSQIVRSPIIEKNKSDEEQLGQFLKNSSKTKQKKIVYYQPEQIRKHSLGLSSMGKQSMKQKQGNIKPRKKLGVSNYLRKQRAKTEIKMSKDIQQINFFQLKTQFANTSDFSLQYLLAKDPKSLQQSSLKRGPVIPNRENIKQLLVRYQPSNQQISMKKLMKSNFCTVQFNKNGVYVGEMIGKVKSGMGILFLQSSTYEGFWKNNNIEKGAEITNEGIYKGTFVNYLKQGKGQFQWDNGQIFVGDWLKGVQHGDGLWINPKGESYNGQWRNGKAEGNGLLMIKNKNTQKCGKKYKGGFVANKRHGFGKQIFANGDIYEGFYKDDKPDGKGKYYWSNGSRYEGQFCRGLRQGVGTLLTPNNSSYIGEFTQDKAEGECEIRLPNGDVYYGMIKGNKKNGKGTLILYEQNQIFNGYWKDDFFVRHEGSRK